MIFFNFRGLCEVASNTYIEHYSRSKTMMSGLSRPGMWTVMVRTLPSGETSIRWV